MQTPFIFHSVNRWLPLTANWIYEQAKIWDFSQQLVLADQMVEPIPEKPEVKFRNAFNPSIFQKFSSRVISSGNDMFRAIELGRVKDSPKVLLSHFGNRGYADLGLKSDKHIVRFYGYDLHRLPHEDPEWLVKYARLFDEANEFWVEGPYMKNQLIEMGLSPSKLKVLPIGTNVRSTDFRVREPSDSFHVLIAGAFKEKKGIREALEACIYLLEGGTTIQVHLVGNEINATEFDRQYALEIRELLGHKILKDRLIHYGITSKETLQEIALKCHVALLPSRWAKNRDCEGGYPILFLDIMATGLPVISTNHCDIPFVINSKNGVIAKKNDSLSLAQEMQSFMNSEDLSERSKAARKTVEEKFDWEVLQQEYKEAVLP